jgi:nucleoside-diphosphate-sugar epimerase
MERNRDRKEMDMVTRHLVTGATGFVGSAIVLELLERTDVDVVCPVRPGREGERPGARLERALLQAAEGSGRPHLAGPIARRCKAVSGDLTAPYWGIAPESAWPVDEVWHSAASLKFEQEAREEIERHNVEGTRHTLDLARTAGCRVFNYVSTAYVAGTRRGCILEELPKPDVVANNCYEQSKIEAERAVASSGLRHRILRPGIVVGYSDTKFTSSDSGFYGYAKRLRQLARYVESRNDTEVLEKLQIPGEPNAPIALVPVDVVAASAVAISLSPSEAEVFHLTIANPPTVGEAESALRRELGMPGPRIVERPDFHSPYDAIVAKGLEFYRSYIRGAKIFDRHNTEAAIGTELSQRPLGVPEIERFARSFIGSLDAAD